MAAVDGLCTLANVKLLLGIGDTTQDTLLEALITRASAAICAHTGRVLRRATYTSEPYAVNGQLYLYLKQWPIQAITSVTLGGAALAVNVGYYLSDADALAGRLYRPQGWGGSTLTRGLIPDAYEGDRDILVTYEAGYYLPDDVTTPPADAHYVAGAADSLPADLQAIAEAAVCIRYGAIQKGADGLTSIKEGGAAYTFAPGDSLLNADLKKALSCFKRFAA
jgi:hypothetical protein